MQTRACSYPAMLTGSLMVVLCCTAIGRNPKIPPHEHPSLILTPQPCPVPWRFSVLEALCCFQRSCFKLSNNHWQPHRGLRFWRQARDFALSGNQTVTSMNCKDVRHWKNVAGLTNKMLLNVNVNQTNIRFPIAALTIWISHLQMCFHKSRVPKDHSGSCQTSNPYSQSSKMLSAGGSWGSHNLTP